MLERSEIINAIRSALEGRDTVRAMWLGGSDATGRTDEWSDIDMQVIVEDEAVEETFRAVELALESLSSITIKLRLPQPTWHGHDQAFYQLQDAEPYLQLDLVVMERSKPEKFLERERHGDAVVIFDKDGLVVPVPLDRDALQKRIESRVNDLRIRFPLLQPLVAKGVWRGSPVESLHFYHAFTLRPLVDLLRIVHSPDRFDFGLRYLQDDLPPELNAAVRHLAFVADGEELLERRKEAEALFFSTLERYDRDRFNLHTPAQLPDH